MRGWTRALLGGLLLCAVAAAGIGLNFTLLRLTGDAHDPVGKLSPRAVFPGETIRTTETQTEPTQTEPTQTEPTQTEPTETVPGSDDGSGKRDDD
jgi:hypothetical protein